MGVWVVVVAEGEGEGEGGRVSVWVGVWWGGEGGREGEVRGVKRGGGCWWVGLAPSAWSLLVASSEYPEIQLFSFANLSFEV